MKIIDGKDYVSEVKQMILDYANELDRDLSFQELDSELDNIKNKYLPPNGEILIAVLDEEIIGMVAYHKFDEGICEMKRLYVKPDFRRLHAGELLVKSIIERAKESGYKTMLLDTILPLKAAISLYKKYGFEECEPYYNNPMNDVVYMMREL